MLVGSRNKVWCKVQRIKIISATVNIFFIAYQNITVFSTDCFRATDAQLTGDGLNECLSAPTHPRGYTKEERQVKCKVQIIRKTSRMKPVKQFIQ